MTRVFDLGAASGGGGSGGAAFVVDPSSQLLQQPQRHDLTTPWIEEAIVTALQGAAMMDASSATTAPSSTSSSRQQGSRSRTTASPSPPSKIGGGRGKRTTTTNCGATTNGATTPTTHQLAQVVAVYEANNDDAAEGRGVEYRVFDLTDGHVIVPCVILISGYDNDNDDEAGTGIDATTSPRNKKQKKAKTINGRRRVDFFLSSLQRGVKVRLDAGAWRVARIAIESQDHDDDDDDDNDEDLLVRGRMGLQLLDVDLARTVGGYEFVDGLDDDTNGNKGVIGSPIPLEISTTYEATMQSFVDTIISSMSTLDLSSSSSSSTLDDHIRAVMDEWFPVIP